MRRALWIVWIVLAIAVALVPATPSGGERGLLEATRPRQPGPGNVLRVGLTSLPSLDPAQARSVDQVLVADQLFDSLTAPDPDTQEAVPSLAARWQASPDQRIWGFALRTGSTFSNGRPITSADVKYTLERVARPGSASPAAELLRLVAGYDAFRKGQAPGLAGIVAPHPGLLQITLDQPWAVLPVVLSSPLFGVVPREAVEAQPPEPSFNDEPVGSGPFQVQSRTLDFILLTPSPGAAEGLRLGGIALEQFTDLHQAYQAFTDGELDLVRVPADEIADAGRRYGRDAFRPYLAELFYAFNLKSPKFADPRFREAIVRGIDRRAIVTAIYQGTVRPIDGTVLDGVAGHQANACGRCGHDPQRARALVAEVFKGKPPPPVAIDYDDDTTQEAIARAIQASLQSVGVTAVLRPRPLRDYDDFALSEQGELFRLGWIAAYPSADAFLPPLFGSDSPNNLTGFANPNIDAILRAARAESNPNRRTQLFRDAERAILDLVPVVPIAQFHLHAVVAKRVKGLELNSLGSFDARRVSLRG